MQPLTPQTVKQSVTTMLGCLASMETTTTLERGEAELENCLAASMRLIAQFTDFSNSLRSQDNIITNCGKDNRYKDGQQCGAFIPGPYPKI